MSRLLMVLVLAVVMGFGAMSISSADVTSEVFPLVIGGVVVAQILFNN